jgi:putative heme-binding domain-containing protein
MSPRVILTVAVACLSLAPISSSAGERPPWTTSQITGTPEPPLPFVTRRLFESLQFREPVDTAFLPGTDWVYVLELAGKIFAFDSSLPEPQAHLVFDARAHFAQHNHSYGITFHPDVAKNRYIYLSWTVPGQMVEDGTTVSRFELSPDNPPHLLPETRTDIIKWPSGGHNGACLKFGPDGYLYISAGDGVGPFPPDSENTGQDMSDLRATIFRIDVNRTSGDLNYAVPSDNPFVDLPEARPEIWAYGFRNPWKMCFSPDNGDFFVGDVGWEMWEMIYRVTRGGNYGWSVTEGRQPVRFDVERGPTPILPPLIDHHHIEARSITGGYVYRGDRLSELQGAYIYGDWVTGKIWGLRNDGNRVTWNEELADTALAIVTFGETRRGELLIVDYAGGFHQLIPNPNAGRPSDFPRKLSETGLFSDVAQQTPAPGVLEYSIVAEPWLEGASARRFVALPQESSIVPHRNREMWNYPAGTVFVRTLSLDSGESHPRPMKLESQILHFDGEEWRPYTYVWNGQQSDADLAPVEGGKLSVVTSGEEWTWPILSRAECSTCHTPRGGHTLGFFPQNLMTAAAGSQDQLALLVEQKVFAEAVAPRDRQPDIVDPYDSTADLEERARAYLMVNCAHCHRREAGGTSPIEFPLENPLERTNALGAPPTQGTFGIPHARIIAPGDPYRSVLFYRLSTVGPGHMPQIGGRRIDEAGLALIHDWITSLAQPDAAAENTAAPPEAFHTHSQDRVTEALAAPSPETLGRVLKSTPTALELSWRVGRLAETSDERREILQHALGLDDPIVRGLFERFVPESRRTRRLGNHVDPAQILALDGDRLRGRQLFASAGVQCRNCHQAENTGREVGPRLDDVGKRLAPEAILESILEPSRTIDAQWLTYMMVTSDGRVLTGLLQERSEARIVIRDPQGVDHAVPEDEIEEMVAQQKSLMPELLVQDLSPEQLADLLAYLVSLK